jgi:RHH-type proline utilization regulon transcriptional repressor/proline dehydrogenase/delta 1-pyrroline-5-carboxylate dehydrogenase
MLPEQPDGAAIRATFLASEAACVQTMLPTAALPREAGYRVEARARGWVEAVRAHHARGIGMESFLQQYDLGTQEGVLLMCVAEALLRIPDADTADRLIRDKLSRGDWQRHLGQSASLLVNASTWGLMLTGRLTALDANSARDPAAWYERIVARAGEPVVRVALRQAMKIMAEQFVIGRTIGEAITRSRAATAGTRHSFDMLGESALTTAGARDYRDAYQHAIAAIGAAREPAATVFAQPSISVKLSALHPRYEIAQRVRVLAELVPALTELCRDARERGIGLTVDAEEAERLELSLEVCSRVRKDRALSGWDGFGLAVQAYQKRALPVVDWVVELARTGGWRVPLRLVKGAYWDSEIKRAQVQGLDGYPVFTRKAHTDVSYLACAQRMLAAGTALYPMFATHNAHSAAAIVEFAAAAGVARGELEFQRLHGMGEALHGEIVASTGIASRVYAPVGSHQELLPYLVRRLLENGANTSFVNHIANAEIPVDVIIADPIERTRGHNAAPNRRLPLPRDLFLPERVNSRGMSLADQISMARFDAAFAKRADVRWSARPIVAGAVPERARSGGSIVFEPAQRTRALGVVVEADAGDVERAISAAVSAQPAWDALGGEARAHRLDRAADAIEEAIEEFVVLLAREAGKTRSDAIGEVREAADFCRYYAALARRQFAAPLLLPSPTGEANELSLHGRGVFACISPWNFPLAIFVGQIAAALAAGNAAIAKPAEQTPLTAACAVECLLAAGIPAQTLALLPGSGERAGAALVGDRRVTGVAFTGSTEVARAIAASLAQRDAIAPLIAETGGMNALVVDSSALPEQVVQDAVTSGFNSAGQRCSALRVLFVQEDIAPRVIDLLKGAMDELVVGDAQDLATDVGPVIDAAARNALEAHIATMAAAGRVRHRVVLPPACNDGYFVAPTLIELDGIDQLEREVFGPVLHYVRYRADALDAVIEAINATGYGLTLGIHSRIDETVRNIVSRVRVGNVYVNRNIIGAVVGVQPFGGEGLSGTGPKAGGPHYLLRFAVERTLTINTAAAGGNATLLALGDSEDDATR